MFCLQLPRNECRGARFVSTQKQPYVCLGQCQIFQRRDWRTARKARQIPQFWREILLANRTWTAFSSGIYDPSVGPPNFPRFGRVHMKYSPAELDDDCDRSAAPVVSPRNTLSLIHIS